MEQDRLPPGQLDERIQLGLSSRMCGKKSRASTADDVYLDLYINGRNYESLLDTGSDVTLIPARYVRNVEIRDTYHTPTAANGTEIAVLGKFPYLLPWANTKESLMDW